MSKGVRMGKYFDFISNDASLQKSQPQWEEKRGWSRRTLSQELRPFGSFPRRSPRQAWTTKIWFVFRHNCENICNLTLPLNQSHQTRWQCWRRDWSRRRSSSGWRCRCGAWSGRRPGWSSLQFGCIPILVKIGLWWDLCSHSSLPICWSVSNHQECQPPSLANTMNNLCMWTKSKFLNWMPGFLKEWKKSISPRLPSVRAGEITGISFLRNSLNRN